MTGSRSAGRARTSESTVIGVRIYCPHPCGGWYLAEARVYAHTGLIGWWMDA